MASIQGGGNPGLQTVDTKLSGTTGANAEARRDEAVSPEQFGDIWKKIQGQYGAKAERPREIKKTLGKDDFMRIMITQMKHQDPTNPFKAEQMATEMAQFTSVEQMQNINQTLNKMATQNQPLERMAMTNLIGKTITVDRDRFPHTDGQNETLNFRLPKDASEVRFAIVSDAGEVIIEKDLGKLKAGDNSFAWDGLKGNTLPAKSGNYMMRVEAKDEKGNSMRIDSRATARVAGVSFEGQEPILLVGDLSRPEKVALRNVVRIESGAESQAIPGAKPLSSAGAPAGGSAPAAGSGGADPSSNFFTFQKGVGSVNLNTANTSAEAHQVLKKYGEAQKQDAENVAKQPASQAGASGGAQVAKAEEKGFPNGLSEN